MNTKNAQQEGPSEEDLKARQTLPQQIDEEELDLERQHRLDVDFQQAMGHMDNCEPMNHGDRGMLEDLMKDSTNKRLIMKIFYLGRTLGEGGL